MSNLGTSAARRRPAHLGLLVLLLLSLCAGLTACAGDPGGGGTVETSPTPPKGTLEGTVKIGPLCPVEPCQETPVNPFANKWIVIHTQDGIPIRIPIHDDGTFEAQVSPGEYRLNLSDCQYLTCREELPKRITITPGTTARVTIDIDTGIR